MRLFECSSCANIVYFENRSCGRCGSRLGYLSEAATMSAFEADGEKWKPIGGDGAARFFCRNAEQDGCNWLVPTGSTDAYCVACRHNGTVPDLTEPGNLSAWQELEFGKHRLFYSLLRWHLPLKTRAEDPKHGLVFNFLADRPSEPKVMTGHENGVITIALKEADDLERERRRLQMGEPYRTILGHFRHEVGHHFWDVLVRDAGKLGACRAIFGDDTLNYEEAAL